MYGIVEGVSDRPYVSNSFHCHVTEEMTPIEKQDCEGRFWELCNGGKIQYVRYPIGYNVDAIRALVRRAMDLGYYEGVNLSLAYCDDCGHEELEMDVCPVCGSTNLTKIDRMNGYLSYSRVHGDTRLNSAKMAEIAETEIYVNICAVPEEEKRQKSSPPLQEQRSFCARNIRCSVKIFPWIF